MVECKGAVLRTTLPSTMEAKRAVVMPAGLRRSTPSRCVRTTSAPVADGCTRFDIFLLNST